MSLEEMLKILDQGSSFQRGQAVEAIGQMGSQAESAVDKLIQLLDIADADLTYLIADALQNISSTKALYAIHDIAIPKFIEQLKTLDREQQEDILISLSEFGELAEPAKDYLIEILNSDDFHLAILAGAALLAIGHKEGLKAVDVFIDKNADLFRSLLEGKNQHDKDFAIFALKKLGMTNS